MDSIPEPNIISSADTDQRVDDPSSATPYANSWPSPPQPTADPPNKIFFGRFGFRAGWGIAIFICLYAIIAIFAGIFAVAATGHLKEIASAQRQARIQAKSNPSAPKPKINIPFAPALAIVQDGISFFALLGMCWFFSKAERRRLSCYGIGKSRLADFLPGAFWGLAALSVLILVLRSLHLLFFDARLLSGPAIFLYAAKWLFAFLLVGFSEEYLLRGYLQFTLTRGVYGLAERISPANTRPVAFWIAAIIMSIVFGLVHLGNAGENALGIGQVVLVGLIFSYALWRTGSLWWAIGFHMAWDWAQSFLYGVADSGNISIGRLFQTHIAGKTILSGGIDGPEGSLLCVPVLLLVLLVIRFTTKPGAQPPLEPAPADSALAQIPASMPTLPA